MPCARALRNLDVVTFYGPINFDEKGRNASKPMGAIQIQNGDILVVAPTNAAVAEPGLPSPGLERSLTARSGAVVSLASG